MRKQTLEFDPHGCRSADTGVGKFTKSQQFWGYGHTVAKYLRYRRTQEGRSGLG